MHVHWKYIAPPPPADPKSTDGGKKHLQPPGLSFSGLVSGCVLKKSRCFKHVWVWFQDRKSRVSPSTGVSGRVNQNVCGFGCEVGWIRRVRGLRWWCVACILLAPPLDRQEGSFLFWFKSFWLKPRHLSVLRFCFCLVTSPSRCRSATTIGSRACVDPVLRCSVSNQCLLALGGCYRRPQRWQV